MQTVLVLGGYGHFGGYLCRALAQSANVRLLIAGRDLAKAQHFAHELGLPEGRAVRLDAELTTLAKEFRALGVDILVHAAGPFQEQDYRVARACIEAGCHYIDLSDARDFVTGIDALDTPARAADVLVVSGASSVPALSSAVVDELLPEFSRLEAVDHAIVAGAQTPGFATIRAILGYCGQPFMRLERGVWTRVFGWQNLTLRRYPDPVGYRWLGNCDVPDLALFPQRYPGLKSVAFHAGIAAPLAHLATWGFSWLVRWHLVSSLAQWARPLRWLNRRLEPFGTHDSAMHVQLSGLDLGGRPVKRTWNLLASRGHGPLVPCGAALALVDKLVKGSLVVRGAMPCVGLLSLHEYLAALAGLEIRQVYG